jgi:hypothetical protein
MSLAPQMKIQSAAMVGLGVFCCALRAQAQSGSTASSANDWQASTTRDAQRLQATLDSLAQPERVERQVAGWTLTGGGVLGATAATYVAIKSQDPNWLLATADGVLVAALGIQTLAQDGPFGYLAHFARRRSRSNSSRLD